MESREWIKYIVAAEVGAAITLIALLIFNDKVFAFSPYQPLDAVIKDYESCKEKAPKGFDCVMVPMMVSEEFMKEKL